MHASAATAPTAFAAPLAVRTPQTESASTPQQPTSPGAAASLLQEREKKSQKLDDENEEDQRQDEDESHRQPGGELEDLSYSSEDDQDGSAQESLDKAMMNELLLVCSNLGMLRSDTEDGEPVFMRGEDCEEWIHDLQRAIRRDHARHKLIAKQLGKWKILQKKLLPLLVNHQHDWSLVFSVMKVLVMLTMRPPRDSSNIAQQLKYLREYKHAFLRLNVIPILMSIIVDPLSKKGSARTSEDYLNMELVLTLIRNLLAIPDEDERFVTSATEYLCHLQEELICTLQKENVYELLVLFSQDIDSAENREWNLLIMEMVDLTLQCTTPKALVSALKRSLLAENVIPREMEKRESLVHKISGEKQLQTRATTRRHSNFGGMVTFVGPAGRSLVLTDLSKTGEARIPQAKRKPQARKRNSRSRPQINDINEVFGSKPKDVECDFECSRVLIEICDSILGRSYFQLTNSLKGEFRRGSSKLVSTDRLQYFHIVWFLTSYHRMKIQLLKTSYKQALKAYDKQTSPSGPPPEKPRYNEKAILSTLDMFSFNFVLQSIETYATSKNYLAMTTALKLLTEMMAYLEDLSKSDDLRMQRIAESLHHKIFYERDFLDRLPVLIKSWAPGLFSLEYAVDVVTLTHLVFKVLDQQGQIKVLSRRKSLPSNRKPKGKDKNKDDDDSTDDEEERQAQLQLEMQRKELDFDVRRYFSSIVTHETIKMYCYLLRHYRQNHVKVNHYVHSFFYRVQNFKVDRFDDSTTMEPMLFNVHVLRVFNKLLNDAAILNRPDFADLLRFAKGVVRNFFELANKNHLLFIECLFRHPFAAKACTLMQKKYESLDLISRSAKEAREQAIALGREQRIANINEARRQKAQLDAADLEGEAEFDFVLQNSDFANTTLVSNADATSNVNADEEGREEQLAGPLFQDDRVRNQRKSRGASERAKNWSKVEDRYLAKMFQRYRHLPSVYEVLSYEDMFQDRDRTAEQIERRVKYLKLHRRSAEDAPAKSSSDEEDNMAELMRNADASSAESAQPTHARRRLRRLTSHVSYALSSSEDEDDVLEGRRNLTIDRELQAAVQDSPASSGSVALNAVDQQNAREEQRDRDQTQPTDALGAHASDEEIEFDPHLLSEVVQADVTQPTQATDSTDMTQTMDQMGDRSEIDGDVSGQEQAEDETMDMEATQLLVSSPVQAMQQQSIESAIDKQNTTAANADVSAAADFEGVAVGDEDAQLHTSTSNKRPREKVRDEAEKNDADQVTPKRSKPSSPLPRDS